MARRTNRETAAVWRERLARQARGSWSIAEFCRQEGISEGAFYYWRRRLGQVCRTGGGKGPNGHSAEPPLLVPVEVKSDLADPGMEIELPGGGVVRLPHDASAEIVTAAVRAACLKEPGKEEVPC